MHNDSFANVDAGLPASEQSIPEGVSRWEIIKKFLFVGSPLMVANIAQFSINTLVISVIGRNFGVEELGGASLALGMLNATAFAFAAGLCGALETVLSHTYGMFQSRCEGLGTIHLYGTYVQRMAIILLFVSIPLGAMVIYIDLFLEFIGQNANVVYFTGRFCRIAAFGIPCTLFFQLIHRYYSCQHDTKPLSLAMLVASVLNPIMQVLFINLFGFDGSAIAWVLLYLLTDAGLLAHTVFSGQYVKLWGGWDDNSCKNIIPLLNLAIPSMAIMLSEWVLLEIIIACAGFAPSPDLAAFSITVQVFTICWGITSGTIVITSVFIGNAVGERKPMLAKRISNVAIAVVFVTSLIDITLCYLLEDYIPTLFTKDEEVGRIYRQLMRFVFPYHVVDSFQSTVMSILRGCGLQKAGALVIGITLCVIGAPLAFFLFFYMKWGVQSLWIGPFCGVLFFGLPLYIYILYWYVDWSKIEPKNEDTSYLVEEEVQQFNDYGKTKTASDDAGGECMPVVRACSTASN
ncbi:putative MatE [Trypanosoma vivax]|uniref:Putative membrane transporter protein n=1 Tax=Trypanosoma vivax (strain Y486) TaxID=1055687 RepID=G0U376_TRYVY|nr:putative membrane transporter protein [Trypanosoma vivax]KAH8604193.1 putative MatE [Trypanosoma vivax]CCC50731.1 putative membrane transporter protein [Trypanosoma vivax Y486]